MFHDVGGRLVRASGYPPHSERFELAGFDLVDVLDDSEPAESSS